MSGNNFNNTRSTPRILVAPLDWGLGHATRCIPIIRDLLERECEVWIAADQQTLFLLKNEFPALVFLRCKGYGIRYSKSRLLFPLKMVFQLPKILFSVWRERRWLREKVKEYGIDAVISDNRPGMSDPGLPSVYITHQLGIKTGNALTETIAQKLHYHFIRKFSRCWVPDDPVNGLAGELSHPENLPRAVTYIGPLSRFHSSSRVSAPKIYDLLVAISGPEPQRTVFETGMLTELEHFGGRVLLVRGLPGETKFLSSRNPSVEIVNHLPAEGFDTALKQAAMVIARSGYSSVMDFVVTGTRAILIPTPGQTEQEYLARYLSDRGYFFTTEQKDFSLADALEKAHAFEYKPREAGRENYTVAVAEFAQSIKTLKFASQ
jgi:predicted glycosyltransferase